MADLSQLYARALQEYLEALADGDELPSRRHRNLLLSYAELQYKLRGGSRCAVCNTPVRHVVPVVAERGDGTKVAYPCLCTRCLEAEKAVSLRVVLRIGQAVVEHVSNGRDYKMQTAPHPELRPMRKVRRAAAS
ncbi:MAG: hypothetical protein ACXVZX_06185 [Terriglobales bacterium]